MESFFDLNNVKSVLCYGRFHIRYENLKMQLNLLENADSFKIEKRIKFIETTFLNKFQWISTNFEKFSTL